jgi:hypothetical protein
MRMETAGKRLAYCESVWAVKEVDWMEDHRKLQLRIGVRSTDVINSIVLLEQRAGDLEGELATVSAKGDVCHAFMISAHKQEKNREMQAQLKLLSEEKEILRRELISLRKQLDYYKVCRIGSMTN